VEEKRKKTATIKAMVRFSEGSDRDRKGQNKNKIKINK
jgi:hypothetical protein